MAKLSDRMVEALRAVDRSAVSAGAYRRQTLDALRSRFLIKWQAGDGYVLTPSGRTALDEHERAEKAKQQQAERASRPVPAGAFVEPSARTAPVLGLEYDEEQDEVEEAPHGPSVRLTPAPAGVEQEATDAEILQLLALLDAGYRIQRALYRDYTITGDFPQCFRLDAEKLNRAARDAVRFGLARQEFSDRLYRLSAEPIHLLRWHARWTYCDKFTEPAGRQPIRLRVTTDPTKATHERCK